MQAVRGKIAFLRPPAAAAVRSAIASALNGIPLDPYLHPVRADSDSALHHPDPRLCLGSQSTDQ